MNAPIQCRHARFTVECRSREKPIDRTLRCWNRFDHAVLRPQTLHNCKQGLVGIIIVGPRLRNGLERRQSTFPRLVSKSPPQIRMGRLQLVCRLDINDVGGWRLGLGRSPSGHTSALALAFALACALALGGRVLDFVSVKSATNWSRFSFASFAFFCTALHSFSSSRHISSVASSISKSSSTG